MAIARDKFWLFGVRPHQDDIFFGPRWTEKAGRKYNWSRITPAEGAFMLDIPNVIMVVCDGQPANFSHEAIGYMESFCRMQNVQWSCTGSDGFRTGNEEEFVCHLAENYPNVSGAYLNDFFGDPTIMACSTQEEKEAAAKLRLGQISDKLAKAPRPMDLHMVCYEKYLDLAPEVLEKVTMLSLWTWSSKNLVNLEQKIEKMEARFPDKKKMLGIYMYDFSGGHPVPNELMEHQCNLGLRMLKEGRIDGMIFEANSIMGVRMESELWLRSWIEENKNTPVPD